MSSCMLYHSVYRPINTMTTRLNNSMIMVNLIRSLLTNLNSNIAIEAKYVELCKYTVTYVGLNFFQRNSAVAEGPRNACRSDLCQSWRCVVWWFRCTLLWARIGRIGRSEGGRSICAEISYGMGSRDGTNHFGVVSRQSFRIPRCVASGRHRFDNRCCFE